MTFKKYPKIYRLGKDEVAGILNGECYIQEKIDGANTSIWLDERGEITCGSRNRELSNGFNGFLDFVEKDDRVKKIMKDHPTWRLYGEWLVPHTVKYNENNYRKWYLFDITEAKDGEKNENFMSVKEVDKIAKKYGFEKPHTFGKFKNPTEKELKEMCGKSFIGEKGEGIVIKNKDFIDKYGNSNYGKLVTDQFKETNRIIFGGNDKSAKDYTEMYIVNKYMTSGRVIKNLNKIQSTMDRGIELKDIPRIMNTCYHDMITEEIWGIQKKCQKINFRRLQKLAMLKAKQRFLDIGKY